MAWLGKKITRNKLHSILPWLVLFLVFLLPGVYLEYPSDTWEHFRRIFRWQEGGDISSFQSDIKSKFSYFWLWTFVEYFPLTWRRFVLGVCSAVSQLFLAAQVHYLSSRFKLNGSWAWVSVFAFFSLFGMGVFSFRYYALSSTVWAYALYLRALAALIDYAWLRARATLVPIPSYLTLIYFLHKQEIIFFLLGAGVVFCVRCWISLSASKRRILIVVVTLLGIAGLFAGKFAMLWHPEIASKMMPGQVNSWGFFRVWRREFWFYHDVVGVYGVIAYLCAVPLLFREPLLAALTLVPALTLIYPPSALVMAKTLPIGYLTFRVLYAMPLTFALVRLLALGFSRLERYYGSRSMVKAGVILGLCVVAGLGAKMEFPWRGKLFFQFHRPSAERSLAMIDETAAWFEKNRDFHKLRRCWLTTDDATRTVIYGHVGALEEYFGGESSRRAQMLDARLFTTTDSLANMVNMEKEFCGILVAIRNKLPATPVSHVASIGKHWPAEAGDLQWLVSEEFEKAAEGLTARGWKKTFVPPFYYLYEP